MVNTGVSLMAKSTCSPREVRRSDRNKNNTNQVKILSNSKRSHSPDEDEAYPSKKIKKNTQEVETKANKRSANNKRKSGDDPANSKIGAKVPKTTQNSTNATEQCKICGQLLNSDLMYYNGHPQNAEEEKVALTDEALRIYSGDDGDIIERPHTNLTGFSIYDKEGHLCPLDSSLVENNVRVYMSGYLKPICSDNPEIDEESIPVKDIRHIIKLTFHEFNGGDNNCITVSTKLADYNLKNPSQQYKLFLDTLHEKTWLSKVVVEYLKEQPTYEELLEYIKRHHVPELSDKEVTEKLLLKHAHFLCDHVSSLEPDKNDNNLITLPCMIKLLSIKHDKSMTNVKIKCQKVNKKAWTKATTTPLVRKTFENLFSTQLDKTNPEIRKTRCGVCEACQLPDCGKCSACKSMPKFGGHSRIKKACSRHLCPNIAVKQDKAESKDINNKSRGRKVKRVVDGTVPVKAKNRPKKIGDVAVKHAVEGTDKKKIRQKKTVAVKHLVNKSVRVKGKNRHDKIADIAVKRTVDGTVPVKAKNRHNKNAEVAVKRTVDGTAPVKAKNRHNKNADVAVKRAVDGTEPVKAKNRHDKNADVAVKRAVDGTDKKKIRQKKTVSVKHLVNKSVRVKGKNIHNKIADVAVKRAVDGTVLDKAKNRHDKNADVAVKRAVDGTLPVKAKNRHKKTVAVKHLVNKSVRVKGKNIHNKIAEVAVKRAVDATVLDKAKNRHDKNSDVAVKRAVNGTVLDKAKNRHDKNSDVAVKRAVDGTVPVKAKNRHNKNADVTVKRAVDGTVPVKAKNRHDKNADVAVKLAVDGTDKKKIRQKKTVAVKHLVNKSVRVKGKNIHNKIAHVAVKRAVDGTVLDKSKKRHNKKADVAVKRAADGTVLDKAKNRHDKNADVAVKRAVDGTDKKKIRQKKTVAVKHLVNKSVRVKGKNIHNKIAHVAVKRAVDGTVLDKSKKRHNKKADVAVKRAADGTVLDKKKIRHKKIVAVKSQVNRTVPFKVTHRTMRMIPVPVKRAVDGSLPFNKLNNRNRGTKIKWIGEPVQTDATKLYYEKVEVNDIELCNGDFVMVRFESRILPVVIKLVYMWKEKCNYSEGYFHGELYIRSSETVLGEVGEPREVYLCNECCHGGIFSSILKKACVEKKEIPADWFNLGGKEVKENPVDDDGKTYFYRKFYNTETARFEDLPENPTCPYDYRKHRFCPSCERKSMNEDVCNPRVVDEVKDTLLVLPVNRTEWSAVKWQGRYYKKGCAVFLEPNTFKFENASNNTTAVNKRKVVKNRKIKKKKPKRKLEKVDENIYTEYYRKSNNSLRGSNLDTCQPYCVGYITAITAKGEGLLIPPQDIYLKVNVMYRPENTKNKFPEREDLNLVYWSNKICEVKFTAVVGPCHLIYEQNVPGQVSLHEWLEGDPNRFYFRSAYNTTTERVVKVPRHATAVVSRMDEKNNTDNHLDKGKGKGKGKSSKPVETTSTGAEPKVRPLRTLDVFAGCGGLSEGLHRAGAAECRWAVENEKAASHAYSLNNKNCAVFTEDCNKLLREVMSGATHSGGLRLPKRGEVELLCGGPPCQGFSGMNRFSSGDYSNFKNSLIASFLSYCDYYRPKYFILENVRNFVVYKRGMVLKLTMRALLDMGYQCTFGVLQAGNYGVPQTRRRLIVLAAAPGLVLPLFPQPTHVFSLEASNLTVTVDNKQFTTNVQRGWAPRRTCTIRDAMGDLPEIGNSASLVEMNYGSMPKSHFQREARGTARAAKLRDHICKKMSPLVEARIARIPTAPGSDWRDLPNISVPLSDGTKSKVLQYRHEHKRNGRSRTGALRGVCACASDKPCSPRDKQDNTLIPWCMPHTGNRNNHWAGIYGRISWEGYFSTTVTDPEPMGKQGRVLHPSQPRVVSVRECARSQGFPDHYMFSGSVQDKYRQIGNAVPPPLALAIGREIKKAMIASTSQI